jgi:hypothetical protein
MNLFIMRAVGMLIASAAHLHSHAGGHRFARKNPCGAKGE